MENPAYWTAVEHVIDRAMEEARLARAEGTVGLSTPALIAKALRGAKLVDENLPALGFEAFDVEDVASFLPEGTEAREVKKASPLQAAVEEYVVKRGIPMPVYTSGSKIIEEAEECKEALSDHLGNPTEATLLHLMEEVADLAIVATIAARQCGFTVEEALRHKTAKDTGRF